MARTSVFAWCLLSSVSLGADGTVEVRRLSPHSRTRVSWDRGTCAPRLAAEAVRRDEKRLRDAFDDARLESLVLNNDEGGDSYFSVPSDALVANVYVMKQSAGEITRLTNNTNSNSVFPAFRKDGKVVYLSHPQRSAAPGAKSTFVVADPERANRMPCMGMRYRTARRR